MLLAVSINNYLLIDSLEIRFSEGFNAIVGETGAGKSIIMEAVMLCFGVKAASSNLHRDTNKPVVISTQFVNLENHELELFLLDKGIECSEELILRRVIAKDGKSKFYINDILVSLSFVKELTKYLIEYTGQHSNFELLSTSNHIKIFDQFALAPADLIEAKDLFQRYQDSLKELQELKAKREKGEIERDFIAHAYKEISELDIQVGEEEALQDKKKRFQDKAKLSEAIKKSEFMLDKQGCLGAFIAINKELTRFQDNFAHVISHVEACIDNIAHIQDGLAAAQRELGVQESQQDIEDRLYAIRSLARKYQVPSNELSNYLENLRKDLKQYENLDELIVDAEKRLKDNQLKCEKVFDRISQLRNDAAERLSQSVMQQLTDLRLEKAEFAVECITYKNPDEWRASGYERIRFLIRTNPRSKLDDIAKIASGGELSRILLALRLVLAETNNSTVLIFDEVDSGMSGEASICVGKKLDELGKNYQVISITHQPQVAAKADHILKVQKIVENDHISINVNYLDKDQKIFEIAKMISGDKIISQAVETVKQIVNL